MGIYLALNAMKDRNGEEPKEKITSTSQGQDISEADDKEDKEMPEAGEDRGTKKTNKKKWGPIVVERRSKRHTGEGTTAMEKAQAIKSKKIEGSHGEYSRTKVPVDGCLPCCSVTNVQMQQSDDACSKSNAQSQQGNVSSRSSAEILLDRSSSDKGSLLDDIPVSTTKLDLVQHVSAGKPDVIECVPARKPECVPARMPDLIQYGSLPRNLICLSLDLQESLTSFSPGLQRASLIVQLKGQQFLRAAVRLK